MLEAFTLASPPALIQAIVTQHSSMRKCAAAIIVAQVSWRFSRLQRHSRENGNPFGTPSGSLELVQQRALSMAWIPAFAGMTRFCGNDRGERMSGNIKLTHYPAVGPLIRSEHAIFITTGTYL